MVDQDNTKNACSTMTNAEIPADKKVDSISPKQSPIGLSGKRIAVKSEGSPVQISRKRSELGKNSDEQCKQLGVSSDGIKKSPVQIKKTRSLSFQKGPGDQNSVGNGINSVQKVKSDSAKALNGSKRELRKMNSEPSKTLSLQLAKSNSQVRRKVIDDEMKEFDDKKVVEEDLGDPVGEIEESPVAIEKGRSDENCKDLKAIAKDTGIEGQIQIMKPPPNVDYVIRNQEEEEEEEEEEEAEEEGEEEVEVHVKKENLDIKNMNVEEQKPTKVVIKQNKFLPNNERSAPKIHNPTPTKTKPIPVSDSFDTTPTKLQSFADLIMWRDVSRSAFVFGIGAFAIISSSYTKDLNISFISVVSYLGLVYLGLTFIIKSLLTRGNMDMDKTKQEYVVGEEEAVWLVKLILPYVNEFLLKLRNLFSGDPATTMKLAVILFILARCGGSITIWKMTKLGFFGVFMLPKLYYSYSSHLAAHGAFWIRRFGDGWESCSHKKALGFGIFSLVWNLSSVVARIWALFILFVAFKYYRQYYCWIKQEEEEEVFAANTIPQYSRGRRQVRGPTRTETK